MNRGARSAVLVAGWLTATPALASDPTGTVSFLYAFLVALPWAAIMLATTVFRAKRGAYDKSAAAARSQAVIGAVVPLAGLAVVAYVLGIQYTIKNQLLCLHHAMIRSEMMRKKMFFKSF